MKKDELKKKLLTVFCLLMLLTPVLAEEPASTGNTSGAGAAAQTETAAEKAAPAQDTKNTDSDKNTENKIVYKEPVSKRKIAMKFIYAMTGVAVSSILLFVILTLYNKIRSKMVQPPSSDYTNTLTTPNNLKDAVNIYLEKTK